MRRRDDLSTPRGTRRGFGIYYDPEAFGRFSEAIARFIGTARFLVGQTILVIVWMAWNVAFRRPPLQFDKPPFIGLTLALSLQAAYAAPLILLAQNRQADRDRAETERDRQTSARTQADTEFLAREIAAIRLALAGTASADDLADAVAKLTTVIERSPRSAAG